MNYYNENDPAKVAALGELVSSGLLPAGDIDCRDIREVRPGDLAGYRRCHFFAGTGGWAYALKMSTWRTDAVVWTGSCPCQPFSLAGLRKGAEDERHLWPEFARLICDCRPSVILGEQVASNIGRQWLAGVRLDLEEMGYGVGAADICAAGLGAPHIRQRLWWCAFVSRLADGPSPDYRAGENSPWMADGYSAGRGEHSRSVSAKAQPPAVEYCRRAWDNARWWPCAGDKVRRIPWMDESGGGRPKTENPESVLRPVADGIPGILRTVHDESVAETKIREIAEAAKGFPVAGNIPGRAFIIRCAGDAIVPQVAAVFIDLCAEYLTDHGKEAP